MRKIGVQHKSSAKLSNFDVVNVSLESLSKFLTHRSYRHRVPDHEIHQFLFSVEMVSLVVVFKEAGESVGGLARVVGDHGKQLGLHVSFALRRPKDLDQVVQTPLIGCGVLYLRLFRRSRFLNSKLERGGRRILTDH